MMNLRALDLNLLVALDALLEEAHVSRAAARIGLSQPAMSNALERCRYVFKDALLERGQRNMRLTPRAEALREPLKNILAEVGALFDLEEVDLMQLRQSIRIMLPSIPATSLLLPLLQRLQTSAPHLQIVVLPWHGANAALAALEKGEMDLAVSVFSELTEPFQKIELSYETYCLVMRKKHPAMRDLNLAQWLHYPHVLVSGQGALNTPLDRQLQKLGQQRTVGVVVPSFLMVLPLLLDSDYISLMPRNCLPPDWQKQYAVCEPPLPVDGFPLHLVWHKRRALDPAVQHVVAMLKSIFLQAG